MKTYGRLCRCVAQYIFHAGDCTEKEYVNSKEIMGSSGTPQHLAVCIELNLSSVLFLGQIMQMLCAPFPYFKMGIIGTFWCEKGFSLTATE